MWISSPSVVLAVILFLETASAAPAKRDIKEKKAVDPAGGDVFLEVLGSSIIEVPDSATIITAPAVAQTRTPLADVTNIPPVNQPAPAATPVYATVHTSTTITIARVTSHAADAAGSTPVVGNYPGVFTVDGLTVTPFLDFTHGAPVYTAPSATLSPVKSSEQATSKATSLTTSAAPVSTSSLSPTFLRGVNLGGWLILEKWMSSDLFTGAFANAVDQYTFDSIPGSADALQTHWSTFYTESDIKTLAATGINALRIPIGFWAYDNSNTPYITGADEFLDQAITWARNAGMKVWVDLHGSPGSQNGFDNSGHAGAVDWQQGDNLARSISVLKTIAAKYGATSYADVVVGIELVNEPISYGNNNFDTTKSWAVEAANAVKAASTNQDLIIVMHDAFEGAAAWTDTAKSLNMGRHFGIDSHLYQLFSDSDNALTQAQHISEACGWASNLAAANAVMPTYVGEWSAATNICVNPDGSTTAGTSCSVEGCQCQVADYSTLNPAMIEQIRKFVEAQLDVFESSTSGYFIWSAKAPGGWGFLNGIQSGAIPNPVTSRKYAGQCGSSAKEKRTTRADVAIWEDTFQM